MTVRDPVLEQA